jgi:hypothetical protein
MKINDLKGLAKFRSSRSDGRSSPPAVSSGYLSAQSQGVKAESADFIEVLAIRLGSARFVNATRLLPSLESLIGKFCPRWATENWQSPEKSEGERVTLIRSSG